ncbi:MAG: hypothetical protein A3E87_08590 [Gammaproteobacteria bacterium RIFCSPHIGHO2_12_FULL_35_23]|nr:MAG: hypothetical protein A3E87_08590 [Gammaproteobacteria bacterium RIFCSPHIGHO2_12_FULL_35_23]
MKHYKQLVLSVLLSSLVIQAFAASSNQKPFTPLQPSTFRAKDFACPEVNLVQHALFNEQPGKIKLWHEYDYLPWQISVPKGVPTPVTLHGFAQAIWQQGNQTLTCVYPINNSTYTVNVIAQTKVLCPDTVPWEASSQQTMSCKGKPELCMFDIVKAN